MEPRHTPLSNVELDTLYEHMRLNPGLYGGNVHRLMARTFRSEARFAQAELEAEAEADSYNDLLRRYRANRAKLQAVRDLVQEALERTEPVSWVDALTDIIGRDEGVSDDE